jgi:hypothetical protein
MAKILTRKAFSVNLLEAHELEAYARLRRGAVPAAGSPPSLCIRSTSDATSGARGSSFFSAKPRVFLADDDPDMQAALRDDQVKASEYPLSMS